MRINMQNQIKNRTFEENFKEFIITMESKNLSTDTIRNYKTAAKIFLDFYGENKLSSRYQR